MDGKHTCPVPRSKKDEIRKNHFAHLSGHYLKVQNSVNAALDPLVINGEKYYLDMDDQKDLIKKAKDAAQDLKNQAQEVFNYLGQLLDDYYEE